MSTPNFHYKNRCIYVSPEDFEDDNYPETTNEQSSIASHSYGSWYLTDQPEECSFLKAVMTAGYYEGACIDYVVEPFDGATDEEIAQAVAEEKPHMNAFLDHIKKLYGYTELNCVATFSNGEAIYEPVE